MQRAFSRAAVSRSLLRPGQSRRTRPHAAIATRLTRPVLDSLGMMSSTSSAAGASSATHGADVDEFLGCILDKVRQHRLVTGKFDSSEKVVDFVHPHELGTKIGLEISRHPTPKEELKDICDKVIQYSVKTCHPAFYNQLYHGTDEYGVAGSWLTDALNTNNHTFEVAPVFIVVEKAVMAFAKKKFGYSAGDGIMSPGGSISNMYGMILARHVLNPELKQKGLFNQQPLAMFTSDGKAPACTDHVPCL